METNRRTFLDVALVCALALSLVTGCMTANDAVPQGRTKLGTVPEFHPELGLGALEGYLDLKALPNSLALIPPPPAPGSAEEVARRTFALRDTPRFARAPYLDTLLRRSFSDFALSTYPAKNHYKRSRPFMQNNEPIAVPEMRAVLEKDPTYPSGHAALGWGYALILSEISPDRADDLIAQGLAFGESRNVANHHWQSYVVWGQFMGAATVARLHADPTFRPDLEAARGELAAVRVKGLSPTRDCKAEAATLNIR